MLKNRQDIRTSAPSPKSLGLRCVQNGSSARREEGAYLDRYVTDEQRSSRPIFNATLWAAAGWLFFLRRGGSTAMIQIAALRSRLEKQPTDLRRSPRDLGDGALDLSACSAAVLSLAGVFGGFASALPFAGILALTAIVAGLTATLSFARILAPAAMLPFVQLGRILCGECQSSGNARGVRLYSEGSS